MASPIDVVKRHMEAEDRHDLDATLATFTEDCWYSMPVLGVELRGKEQIRGHYEELFRAVPDFANADERYHEGDGFVLYEALMQGTHTGTWEGWAPTGRRFSSPMLVRIPIAPDGLMEAEVVYFNPADIFEQLGILPVRGSRQERALQRLHALRTRLSRR